MLAAAWLTQLLFPIEWRGLVYGSDAATGVLVARNVLLAVAATLSCWRILGATSAGREDPPVADVAWTAWTGWTG